MKNSLYSIIKDSQNGDKEKLMDIIYRFKPIIDKYSRRLKYEEAETDLIINLIEKINSMKLDKFDSKNEGAIVNYICSVIRNKHIDLFRKYVERRKEEVEINLDIIEDRTTYSMEGNIFIEDLLNTLPEVQKTIIKEKYIKDHSDIEIAKKLNITRQAVNRSKNRAIENLKKYLCVNLMTV